MPRSTGAKVTEEQLRALLARKAREISKAVVSDHCRLLLATQARWHHWLYNVVEALAASKKKRGLQYVIDPPSLNDSAES